MPGTDKFKQGKYGQFNPAFQGNLTLMQALTYVSRVNPELFTKHTKLYNKLTSDKYAPYKFKEVSGLNRDSANFLRIVLDDASANECKTALSEYSSFLEAESNKPENAPAKGYFKYLSFICNPEKGSFTAAIHDSFHISQVLHSTVMMPKFFKYNPAEIMQATGGENGPLPLLDDYFASIPAVLEAEYEKQTVLDDYSKDKETAYLTHLSQAYTGLINAYEKYETYTLPPYWIRTIKRPMMIISTTPLTI